MKHEMLSFRLDSTLLNKVTALQRIRHRTRGAIIREALEMYYNAYSRVSRSDMGSPATWDESQ